jgi:hypothetical protein
MFATVLQQCLRSTSMKVPKILPWLANRAGISEDLALELWRCAARETEMSIADCDSSDYYGRAIARLVDLAESEGKQSVVHGTVGGETRLSWSWRHQNRISKGQLLAVQNIGRLWQANLNDFIGFHRHVR